MEGEGEIVKRAHSQIIWGNERIPPWFFLWGRRGKATGMQMRKKSPAFLFNPIERERMRMLASFFGPLCFWRLEQKTFVFGKRFCLSCCRYLYQRRRREVLSTLLIQPKSVKGPSPVPLWISNALSEIFLVGTSLSLSHVFSPSHFYRESYGRNIQKFPLAHRIPFPNFSRREGTCLPPLLCAVANSIIRLGNAWLGPLPLAQNLAVSSKESLLQLLSLSFPRSSSCGEGILPLLRHVQFAFFF